MRPSERYVAQARELAMRALTGYPVEVYLFGSWARGDARRTSDIDIAVLPKGALPGRLLPDLREAFEGSRIPYPVDVVDLSAASPALRERVLKEGIRWSA